jgi:hypothetical protein
MAPSQNNTNNPSGFEQSLSELNEGDTGEFSDDESQELYAQGLDADRNQERRSRLQGLRDLAKDKAKKEASKYIKKKLAKKGVEKTAKAAAKKVASKAAATGARMAAAATAEAAVGFFATPPGWGVVLAIIGAIFILIVVIGLSFVGLYYVCTDDGWSGWLSRAGSTVAYSLGATSSDACRMFPRSTSVGSATTGTSTIPLDYRTSGKIGTPEGDAAARALLAAQGIRVNALQPQTSLEGMLTSTLQEVIWLKYSCETWAVFNKRPPDPTTAGLGKRTPGDLCDVVVTGGTELGRHSTKGTCIHSAGLKVDIRVTNNVDDFIKFHLKPIEARGNDLQWYNASTHATYALEPNPPHWDIMVGCP